MKKTYRILAYMMTLTLIIAIFGTMVTAGATTGSGPVSNPTVSIGTGKLVLKTESGMLKYSTDGGSSWTDYTGSITVSGTGSTTANTISVLSGTHNVTLDGVAINVSSIQFGCAFSISSGAAVNLTLVGINSLISGLAEAGLGVPSGASLTVTAASSGSLTAYGGIDGAGIGGGHEENGGSITISGGNLTVYGGDYGAGIGGGYDGTGGSITIDGGSITVYGGAYGAGVGGGEYRDGGTIIISGGDLIAYGGSNGGAGIGGGYQSGGGNITISGGSITAGGGTVRASAAATMALAAPLVSAAVPSRLPAVSSMVRALAAVAPTQARGPASSPAAR